MLCRMLSSISGFYPLDASSAPASVVVTARMFPDILQIYIPWWTDSLLVYNHNSRYFWFSSRSSIDFHPLPPALAPLGPSALLARRVQLFKPVAFSQKIFRGETKKYISSQLAT